MSYFNSADQVYETLGQLVRDVVVSGGLGPQLQLTNASVQLALSDPQTTITLAFAEGEDPTVDLGATGVSPTLTLQMSADTAHEIFSGQRNLFAALDDGRLTLLGGGRDFLGVWPALAFALPGRYAQILEATGHSDLASGA